MIGFGTLANVLFIIAGGVLGCLAGSRLKDAMRETLLTITGVGVVMLGAGGALAEMLTVNENGSLSSGGTVMMIVCLAAGAIIGEAVNLEGKIVSFGEWLKKKSGSGSDSRFVSGFVTASCTVCIGAMAVMGSIRDGVLHDPSVLIAKGVIDCIIICVMAAGQGKGCVFSAVPVALLQGTITVLAALAGDFLPAAGLSNLNLVGGVLILCVGLNLVREKQIRVANLLPAIVFAVGWGFFA